MTRTYEGRQCWGAVNDAAHKAKRVIPMVRVRVSVGVRGLGLGSESKG